MARQTQKRTYETTWRAKWLADGAATLEEVAQRLTEEAAHVRAMAAAGLELSQPVQDDYGFITTEDEKLAQQFQMHELDDDGEDDFDEGEDVA